jgi:endogenous inhibitor of DNA gyrase (YacG/DUF329 family)
MSSAVNPPEGGAPCPICAKPGQPRFSPFCSRRCADIDLGRWLKGNYAIPGRPEDDVDKVPDGPPGEDEASES